MLFSFKSCMQRFGQKGIIQNWTESCCSTLCVCFLKLQEVAAVKKLKPLFGQQVHLMQLSASPQISLPMIVSNLWSRGGLHDNANNYNCKEKLQLLPGHPKYFIHQILLQYFILKISLQPYNWPLSSVEMYLILSHWNITFTFI